MTVLFVDDDADTRFAYHLVASEAGMIVDVAADGTEAISLATVLLPDVIVLDLGLRSRDGLDGLDVARRLRASTSTSTIPIIIVSGSSSHRDQAAVRASGCEGHLVKPCSAEALVGLMTALARSPRVNAGASAAAAV